MNDKLTVFTKNGPDIILGNTYRDKVTKFEGVALGVTFWLTGCDTVGLLGPARDGKVPDPYWVDVTRVEQVAEEQPATDTKAVATTNRPGGPQPTPGPGY